MSTSKPKNTAVQPAMKPVSKKNRKTRRERKAMKEAVLEKTKEVKNEKVAHIKRGDERLARQTAMQASAPASRGVITHIEELSVGVLQGPPIAWISAAAQRGAMAAIEEPSKLYWAFVYCFKILLAAANGSVIPAQQLPRWLHCLCAAIRPKQCNFDLGVVSYKFEASTITPPPNIPVGSATYGYEWIAYIFNGTLGADMFPVAVPPAAYTDENGQIAFNEIAEFMQNNSGPAKFANDLVPFDSSAGKWEKDVSCFSYPIAPKGVGFSASGGWDFTVGHEVLPLTPMFAPFCKTGFSTPLGNVSRSPSRTTQYCGDTITVGNNMIQLVPHVNWRQNRRPLIHFVDFLAFGHVLSSYVSKLQEQRVKDVAGDVTIIDPAVYQCPITLQEMLLILRNEMMNVLGLSQAGYQSIYPVGPASTTDNKFVPFLSGPTTVAVSSTGMKLPLIFVENIKSMISRVVYYQPGGKDPQQFIGVLGQYEKDVLNPNSYVFSATPVGGTTQEYNSFATEPPVLVKRRTSKGPGDWAPQIEVPISLIDGSSGNDYLFINDMKRLNSLTTLWNEWITSLSAYSSPLTSISRDLGVNILCGVAMTRHWINADSAKKEEEEHIVDTRFQKRKYTLSPYTTRSVVAVSSHAELLAGPYEAVQNLWVLPVNQIDGGVGPEALVLTRVQDILKESHSNTTTSDGEQGQSLGIMYDSYASKMVHQRDAPSSELDQFFTEMTSRGQGGILSSLAADFLGKALGPTAGAVASAIAGALPI